MTINGLRFEALNNNEVIDVSVDGGHAVVIPTVNFIFLKKDTRRYSIDGTRISEQGQEKRALWDFDETTVLRPGMSIRLRLASIQGASIVIDVPDAYTQPVHNYYKRRRLSLWQGNGIL